MITQGTTGCGQFEYLDRWIVGMYELVRYDSLDVDTQT